MITAIPWRVGDAGTTVFGPPNGTSTPTVIAAGLSRDHAALIVRSVNDRPELIASLSETMRMLDAAYRSLGMTPKDNARFEKNRAVLAKAQDNDRATKGV